MNLLIAAAALQAAASIQPQSEPAPAAVTTAAVDAVQPSTVKLTALTPVRITVDQALASNAVTIGQEFDIELAIPIDLGNGYAVPAGTKGRGWVIHASKARMGGKPGELLLGARYLKLGDVEIPLRSMKLGSPQGKDNTGLSMGLVAAVGVAGMFVSGGQARVQSGMDAVAKIAADVEVPTALLQKATPVGPAVVATLAPAEPAAPVTPASAQPVQPEKSKDQ